jgi:uncharacterized protein
MTKPKLIDAWIQPWTDGAATAIPPHRRNQAAQRAYDKDDRKARGIPIETMMAEMDAAGIDLALLSGGPFIPIQDVLDLLDRFPGRFRGVIWVDPSDGIMPALCALESHARDYPIVGFRLEPFILWREPTDRIFYPIYAKLVELDLALAIQVGGTMPLYPSWTGRPMYIDQIALDFPELRIVCGHVGSPWTEEMIHVAWKHENVYIDTSARLPKYWEPAFAKFMSSYGKTKCLFASDWPVLDFQRCLDQVDRLNLSEEVARLFFADNAIRAFKLDF